jgi:hypothetical protein
VHELGDVLAEAVRVGGGVARLVDAGVDRAPQVLDERAEEAAVDRAAAEVGVQGVACLGVGHRCLAFLVEGRLQRCTG